MNATSSLLPAQRLDTAGQSHIDYAALARLAWPLILNSALQSVLSLTDTWFIGRLSTAAVAAIGATYLLIHTVIFFVGGVALGVQTLVAQAYGARDTARAAGVVWTGLWMVLITAPFFFGLAQFGAVVLAPFGLEPEIQSLAVDYWLPRLLGSPFAVATWVLVGFFSGIGRTRVTLVVTVTVALVNAVLNPLFMFGFGWHIAGSAWATTVAQVLGVGLALAYFLGQRTRLEFRSHQTWRPRAAALRQLLMLGVPMGLSAMADIAATAVFQLMLVSLGAVQGAASQIVLQLTSLAYMPGLGIAMAGTTLVGQAIGAGAREWALRLGNGVIRAVILVMGVISVGLAVCGPWLAPLFIAPSDPQAAIVGALAVKLLWIGAAYQVFDGLNIGSSLCLRGAGDSRVPALVMIGLAWFGWVPLTHVLTFSSGEGWLGLLPHYGQGAVGGWFALTLYVFAAGMLLNWRWRSRVWQGINLH